MHRFFYRTVSTAKRSSVSIRESCVALAKCGKAGAPAYWLETGGGARALSTGSVKICEKKSDVFSANEEDKPAANSDVDATETPTLITQTTEDDGKVVNAVTRSEEPAVLKTDDENTTQQHMDVNVDSAIATNQIKSTVAKGINENLRELLRGMKVEVTRKRNAKDSTENESYTSTHGLMREGMESTARMFQHPKLEAASKSESLDPDLLAAAFAAASTLPNQSQAESDIIKQLKQHEPVSGTQKKGSVDLRAIIAGMKVGQNSKPKWAQPGRWFQSEEDVEGYKFSRGFAAKQKEAYKKKAVLSQKRLNIFSPTPEEAVSTVAPPTLWDMDFANKLSLSINHMPCNEFQEMIAWTKEGKLWQYPINNEAGLDEEASVSFDEHIFLEKHLEEGFPREGPVRHFMELVVAGLSRNPYLTVQNKKDHISWYREYFDQKKECLKEANVYLE
ncbi:small ribosomal subunit protein mS31 [Brachionichthys hirsutus]|uniref:small ribosomal subunit protein mS31 n=1 Tax=Brachionichthys hirsutus TaxID=412623 RepID=UPI00360526F9